jgi:hypothetical protein
MLLELASFKAIKYRSKIDGASKDFEAMLCVVSNLASLAGECWWFQKHPSRMQSWIF